MRSLGELQEFVKITWPIINIPSVSAVINIFGACLLNEGINYGDASGTTEGRWEVDTRLETFEPPRILQY